MFSLSLLSVFYNSWRDSWLVSGRHMFLFKEAKRGQMFTITRGEPASCCLTNCVCLRKCLPRESHFSVYVFFESARLLSS